MCVFWKGMVESQEFLKCILLFVLVACKGQLAFSSPLCYFKENNFEIRINLSRCSFYISICVQGKLWSVSFSGTRKKSNLVFISYSIETNLLLNEITFRRLNLIFLGFLTFICLLRRNGRSLARFLSWDSLIRSVIVIPALLAFYL